MAVKMWQRAPANNELQDLKQFRFGKPSSEAVIPKGQVGIPESSKEHFKNADFWAQHLEIDSLFLKRGSEVCILEKLLVTLQHNQSCNPPL